MRYIANIRMPTEKAHGIQIVKTCEALARLGEPVELIVPDRATSIVGSPFAYYGVAETFAITRLPVLDTVSWGFIGFFIETLSFALAVRRYARRTDDTYYGRDERVLRFLPHGRKVFWESHTGAWNGAARILARRAAGIIVISEGLKQFYIGKGVPASKLLVAHDGVDVETFAHHESQEEARTRLGLPLEKKMVLYIGRLDGWKGVETFCDAAAFFPADVQAAVIGGEPAQVQKLRSRYPKVSFLGYRPYRELADNQAAADVLVLSNTGTSGISERFTSPLKLFSYMASGVPIVASDLPSVREVVDERCAYLVKPDDPQALARGIEAVLTGTEPAERAARARERVSRYDWRERGTRILSFIRTREAL